MDEYPSLFAVAALSQLQQQLDIKRQDLSPAEIPLGLTPGGLACVGKQQSAADKSC